jgi:hypothetical protein
MAKTCAIFACLILACSECHELFNHEASQSKHDTCLSAAGNNEEFLCSVFAKFKLNARIQQLLTGTKHYQNGILIYLPESQDNCGSGGMLSPELRWLPHIDIGRPPLTGLYGPVQIHTEE